jgi:hypothetical protein
MTPELDQTHRWIAYRVLWNLQKANVGRSADLSHNLFKPNPAPFYQCWWIRIEVGAPSDYGKCHRCWHFEFYPDRLELSEEGQYDPAYADWRPFYYGDLFKVLPERLPHFTGLIYPDPDEGPPLPAG